MYCELHNHGYYSLLDGFNSPTELANVAAELGHNAVSLTDHGTLAGHRELQQACIAAGIKPILGVEAYISATDRFDRRPVKKRDDNTQLYHHIILQAKSQAGLQNLQAMSEKAWSEGFYMKPRIDKELLDEYGDGLVVLSGCMNGLVAKAIENEDDETARKWMTYFADRFGEDFYVEVQPHNPVSLNRELVKLANEFGIKPVVTNDCHFTKESERASEEIMLILSTNPKDSKKTYSDVKHLEFFEMLDALYPDRTMSFADLDLFLKTEQQVRDALTATGMPAELATACIESTTEIAAKIGDYAYHEKLDLLPKISIDVPDSVALRAKVEEGLAELGLQGSEYTDRINEELATIEQLEFSRYFLIVADVMREAKSRGILCGPGRGSSAGSLVVYALGITDVDPIEHGLLFFRFLDPDRGDWPDIDMDFPDDRRHEMVEYMRQTYGHVANISTYGFFTDKGVIKSVARALRVPYNEVMAMTKTIDTFEEYEDQIDAPVSEHDDLTAVQKFHGKYPMVIDYARKLRGKINLAGLHPAGIVVSSRPIEEFAPVEYRKDSYTGDRIAALVYDQTAAEDVGLIKFDFLGLKTLAVVAHACELAGVQPPRSYDDQAVLDEYIKGNTVGIFQAEQSAYTKLLRQMDEVSFTFADLVASNALVRPGAMKTVGKEYLARRAGHAPVSYDHPEMESITKETYGVLIYQEQLMQAAVALGGFTMVEANKLRRIIGKKKDIEEFKPFEDKWMAGASKLVGTEKARKLWGDFQAHAGYSFNKSHAVAYSMLSYWTMWLKHYYPTQFLAAALAAEKTATKNPKWARLLLEAKRLDIGLLLPHVNLSAEKPTVHDGKILLGLSNIKYISDKVSAPLLEARPFKRYADLAELAGTKNSGISTRVLSSLNAVNAAALPDNPQREIKGNLYEYIGIPSFKGVQHRHPERITPLEEFEENGAYVVEGLVLGIKRGKGWSRVELLDETALQGIFHDENTQLTEGSYLTFLVAQNRIVEWVEEGQETVFSRWLAADRLPSDLLLAATPRVTKAGKTMATAVFSDPSFRLTGALCFPKTYDKLKHRLRPGILVRPFIGEMDDGGFMLKGLD